MFLKVKKNCQKKRQFNSHGISKKKNALLIERNAIFSGVYILIKMKLGMLGVILIPNHLAKFQKYRSHRGQTGGIIIVPSLK